MWNTPLRGRDLQLDEIQEPSLKEYISEGRWFTTDDNDNMVAVVTAERHYPPGQRPHGVGDIIRLVVPRIGEQEGQITYDFANPLLYELTIIGIIDIPARASVLGEQRGPNFLNITLQLYTQSDEIQIPLDTWQRIYREAGGDLVMPQQLALQVEDLSYLEDIVTELRQNFNAFSFYSVPQLLERADNFLIENAEKAILLPNLAAGLVQPPPQDQAALALDLRLPMVVLIFINAAMVIASNLLIMVSERKQEIGILKAVGSTRGQVVQMVLSEALLVSSLGSLMGFAAFRLPAVFNQLTNGVALANIGGDVLRDLFMVLAVAGAASLVFGMIPAITMANLSVKAVLQGE